MLRNVQRSLASTAVFALGTVAGAQPCEWAPLGAGVNGGVTALAVFDDGRGDALYAGGSFRAAGGQRAYKVARWDGAQWSALGAGMAEGGVNCLAVFDDGQGGGPALYAGGSFEKSGGAPVSCIARWDGDSWLEVGGGIRGARTKAFVRALTVFDDRQGGGPALYAGGEFLEAGGVPVNYIAKWDGEAWTPLGVGVYSYVYAMAVFDDGSGPALYVGGQFKVAGGTPANYIARWDGHSWSEVGGGLDERVSNMTVYDDGSGPALYVSGRFTSAGGVPAAHLAKWDGQSWSEVGGGGPGTALGVFDDGRGSGLYVGGSFTMAGSTPANNVARWDGEEWSALGDGVSGGTFPGVTVFAAHDDGAGPALYAGGTFAIPGENIARWRCERAGCYADCDGDGELTFFDFLCFQNLFAAADPRADCDESGQLDFFDFLCFQNAFAAGCE